MNRHHRNNRLDTAGLPSLSTASKTSIPAITEIKDYTSQSMKLHKHADQ